MEIIVLTEDIAREGFLAEHGVSFLIKHNGKKLLFDTGQSDVFIKNAEKMGVILDVDAITLSHGHYDHSRGLKYLAGKKLKLIAHPLAFKEQIEEGQNIGTPMSKEEAQKAFNLIEAVEPYNIFDEVLFLGEVPRESGFEQNEYNELLDDSGVVIKTNKGLVVISGCAHSGIVNIIEHSKRVAGIEKVYAVIGGFHLRKTSQEQIEKTIEYFKEERIEKIMPCHCNDAEAMTAFHNAFEFKKPCAGDVIEL
ncbi:MAG: MBL fold metallo-hydrolase [archaeon]